MPRSAPFDQVNSDNLHANLWRSEQFRESPWHWMTSSSGNLLRGPEPPEARNLAADLLRQIRAVPGSTRPDTSDNVDIHHPLDQEAAISININIQSPSSNSRTMKAGSTLP